MYILKLKMTSNLLKQLCQILEPDWSEGVEGVSIIAVHIRLFQFVINTLFGTKN